MSQTIPIDTREPQILAAGDNVSWRRQIDDYAAGTWTLHYVLQGPTSVIKFDATNDAGLHLVTLLSTTTAGWKPGLYSVSAYVTVTTQQVQVSTFFPTITITPNLASTPNSVDVRTWAAKCLAAIEDAILRLSNRTISTTSVNGQVYTLQNVSELFALRERFKSEVAREEEQARLNAGLSARNKIGVRFKSILSSPWPPSVRPPWL